MGRGWVFIVRMAYGCLFLMMELFWWRFPQILLLIALIPEGNRRCSGRGWATVPPSTKCADDFPKSITHVLRLETGLTAWRTNALCVVSITKQRDNNRISISPNFHRYRAVMWSLWGRKILNRSLNVRTIMAGSCRSRTEGLSMGVTAHFGVYSLGVSPVVKMPWRGCNCKHLVCVDIIDTRVSQNRPITTMYSISPYTEKEKWQSAPEQKQLVVGEVLPFLLWNIYVSRNVSLKKQYCIKSIMQYCIKRFCLVPLHVKKSKE